MASAGQFTSGIQTTLHAKKAGSTALSATGTALSAFAGTDSPLSDKATPGTHVNRVEYVDDIGDISQEPNPIRFTNFGEETGRSIAGIPDLGSFSFTCNLRYDEASHQVFFGQGASGSRVGVGDEIDVVIKTSTAKGASSYDYLRGPISSITKLTPKDSQAQISIGMELAVPPVLGVPIN